MPKTISEFEIINIIPDYDTTIQYPDYERGLILRSDMEVMLRLLRATHSKNIFEFGTWAGKTTRILSLYLDYVYTLDIDKESADLSELSKDQIMELSNHNDIGHWYKGRDNIKQFYGNCYDADVMKFVRNSIGKQVDSCFIDANHNFVPVLSDSLQARAMVKSGGLIMWHDVKDDPSVGVIKALEMLPFTVYHVDGSWIGFCIND